MKKKYFNSILNKRVTLLAAACCVATAAHAQTSKVYYSTGFDGPEVTNGTPGTFNYNTGGTPSGTQPLAGQNNWASNDSAAGVENTSAPYQTNGGTSYVGVVNASAFGGTNAAALGGQFRNPGSTDNTAPDVVPSSATGGLVNLFHPVSLTPAAPTVVVNVDFIVTASTLGGHDNFAFSLRTGGTATTLGSDLLSINFVLPTTPSQQATQDNIGYTTGAGVLRTTGSAITLNAQYHLQVTLTTGASPTFLAVIAGGGNSFNFGGALTADPANINQVSADWAVASGTITNGGYTGAGNNSLGFDNLTVAVPEPSTYAMMALGLAGLGVLLRRKVA